MGVISTAASLIGVAGNITGTVFSMGSAALSFGGKFIKSWPGKLAIGAVAGSILKAKISGDETSFFGQLFEKASGGFKDFFNSVKTAVGMKAVEAVAKVDSAGEQVSSEDLFATKEDLENMVASDAGAVRGAPEAAADVQPDAPFEKNEMEPVPEPAPEHETNNEQAAADDAAPAYGA